MKNNMHIRLEHKDYADFGSILKDIKDNTITEYYLVVNGEEVKITSDMAFGMTAFFKEYNREVCKIDEA